MSRQLHGDYSWSQPGLIQTDEACFVHLVETGESRTLGRTRMINMSTWSSRCLGIYVSPRIGHRPLGKCRARHTFAGH